MTSNNFRYAHLVIAAIPFMFTPVVGYLLGEGFLNSGDKSIVLILPYIFWASIFLITAVVLILKRGDLSAWMKYSAVISFGVILFVFRPTPLVKSESKRRLRSPLNK